MREQEQAVANQATRIEQGWVTRAKAAELARVSPSTLRRKQREGALKARHNEQGKVLYLVDELIQIRRSSAELVTPEDGAAPAEPSPGRGERAAEAFARFAEGQSAADVVIAMRMDPDEAGRLREQWAKLSGRGLWVSEAVLGRMLRASLAMVPAPKDAAPLDAIDSEEALVRAVARAVDAAQEAYQAPHSTAAELAEWLSVRWRPSEPGTLSLSAAALGCLGVAHVERFKLAEWTSVEALVAAVAARAAQAQRVNQLNASELALLHDGAYEVVLELASGTQRTWWNLPSPVLRELLQSAKHGGETRALSRLRQLLAREQDAQQNRVTTRRQELAEKARERREESQERARDRAEERKAARAVGRGERSLGGSKRGEALRP